MKEYSFNPTSTNKVNNAKLKEFLQEIELATNALITYRDLSNPNYLILNKIYNRSNNSIVTPIDIASLFLNNILYLSYDNIEKDFVILICPNRLKLHQGIINQYGDTTRIIYNPEQLTIKSESEYDDNELKTWLKIHLTLDDDSLQQFLSKFPLGFKVYNLPASAKYIEQGHVVFCNIIEENEQTTPNSNIRKQENSYKILPISSACGYYVPSLEYSVDKDKNTGQWTGQWIWNYIPNATDNNGTEVYINLWNIPSRYYYHDNGWYDCLSNSKNFDLMLFEAGRKHNFLITTAAGSLWTGFDNNILINNYVNMVNENGIYNEEEIFIDDEIKYGTLNIDKTSDPYYNITIKNEINFSDDINFKVKIG